MSRNVGRYKFCEVSGIFRKIGVYIGSEGSPWYRTNFFGNETDEESLVRVVFKILADDYFVYFDHGDISPHKAGK